MKLIRIVYDVRYNFQLYYKTLSGFLCAWYIHQIITHSHTNARARTICAVLRYLYEKNEKTKTVFFLCCCFGFGTNINGIERIE